MATTVYFINPDLMRNTDFVEAFYGRGVDSEIALERLVHQEGAYEEVAMLPNITDRNAAFRFTQHIDDAWTDAQGIVLSKDPSTLRSSMVGDVFIVDGEGFATKALGFYKLPDHLTKRLQGIEA